MNITPKQLTGIIADRAGDDLEVVQELKRVTFAVNANGLEFVQIKFSYKFGKSQTFVRTISLSERNGDIVFVNEYDKKGVQFDVEIPEKLEQLKELLDVENCIFHDSGEYLGADHD